MQVKVLRELCTSIGIPDTTRASKVDLIVKLKNHLKAPDEFVKVFSKFWGGSGKTILSGRCISLWLPACLTDCMHVCLFMYLFVCLSACLYGFMSGMLTIIVWVQVDG